jgi:transposase
MLTQLFFPNLAGVRVEHLWWEVDGLHLAIRATGRRARCPQCGRRSRRVQSHYQRTLADVACCGSIVTLHVQARRFWCRVPWCRRRIFCERLPDLAAPWARRTVRLDKHLRDEGFALGGDPGARRAQKEATPVSARTLLRLVRATPLPAVGLIRVLGVDDWAWRKGSEYGTILVDLEQHRVIDLLPDRTAATLAAWLRQHPEVEIVSRDRAGAYADGIRRGAPQAIQVADRFHLEKNLTEVIERVLARHHAALRSAAEAVVAEARAAAGTTEHQHTGAGQARPPTRVQVQRQARRERRLARYRQVMALNDQGYSQRQIADALGIGRHQVRLVLRADGFPEQSTASPRWSALRRYESYLRERWVAGCDNAMQLWRELRDDGYPGSASHVRQFVARWRKQPSRPGRKGPRPVAVQTAAPPPTVHIYSPRQTTWHLLHDQADLTAKERAYIAHLLEASPTIARLQVLALAFRELVHQHDLAAFATWLEEVDQADIAELTGFANGVRADRAAVEAGITLPWSQGQTEGQVNRLKTLKRAMYGRGKLDLLKLRLLRAA